MKNNLRVERAIIRISQQELANKIGVTRQTINAIELEKYAPSAIIALKMSVIFGKPVNEFLYLEETDW